ncbi:MAG: hypothetical protein QOF30_400 [Acidimicrobiaceae bacterium]|jgi:hypothetical protein|nr:hypothetical protein [Acidimicrobiaceae bacterium]
MRRNRWATLGLFLAMAGATTACSGRISLGTEASACFRDLPTARQAVHDKGKLVGVRRVSADTLRDRLPADATLATLPNQDLCVFAFSGTYDPGSVVGADATKTGHFAIVAVSAKHPEAVAAVVVDELPTRFRHLH